MRVWKAAKTSALLCVLFLVIYCSTNWLASLRHGVRGYPFAWERHIPFVPLMIIPYMSIDLFFIASPFFCRDDLERRTLARRVAAAILMAGSCFLLFPMRFAFERPAAYGWLGVIFDNFRMADRPFNQFPSLHITLGVILAVHYGGFLRGRRGTGVSPVLATWRDGNLGYRAIAFAPCNQHGQDACATKELLKTTLQIVLWLWFSLILLSAVLTYQHHVIDVIGGFALAVVCFHFIQDEPLGRSTTGNGLVGTYYLYGALLTMLCAFAWRPWSLILLWPATSLALLSTGYFGLGPMIYRKKSGRLPLTTHLLLAPVLLGQYISLAHYARKCDPWNRLTDHLWIGRKLSSSEAWRAIAAGVTAVLDLTAEFSETEAFRNLDYQQFPLLDLTAPSPEQLRQAFQWIRQRSESGVVYVHCKAGYSRTAAVAGVFLIASGEAKSADEAIHMLRRARPTIVVRPEAEAALRAWKPQSIAAS